MSQKLVDLDPRWLNPERTVFAFRCPHCPPGAGPFITCKSVVMGHKEQWDILQASNLEPGAPRYGSIASVDACAWNVSGDFENMTVTPSIDASAAGHWHGFITNGEIK